MKIFLILLLLLSSSSQAGLSGASDVDIYDSSGNAIDSTAGSLNVNVTGGGGGGTVNQGSPGPSPWPVTDSELTTINSTLGTPFQAGGSIGNSSFGISGNLPDFISTPTFNVGTTGGLALDATLSSTNTKLDTINTTLGSPFQAGGSIGNTAFTANAGTNLNTSALNLEATQSAFKTANHTDLSAIATSAASIDSKTTAVNTGAVIAANRSILSQNITGAGQTIQLSTIGMGSIAVDVSGTFVGTLSFEASIDGSTWFAWYGWANSNVANIQSVTAPDQIFFNSQALTAFRVNCSAYTSGTAVVSISANQSFGGAITGVASNTNLNGKIPVAVFNSTGSNGTIPVSSSTFATSALQTSGNTSLSTISTNTTAISSNTSGLSTSLSTINTSINQTQPRKLYDGNGNPVTSTTIGLKQGLDVNVSNAPLVKFADSSGTFLATLPTSLSTLPALVASSAVIGHVVVDTAPSTAVTNTGTFAVQSAQSGSWLMKLLDSSGTVIADSNALPVKIQNTPLMKLADSSGTFLATLPVSGPLTDTQLRATAPLVKLSDSSGTFLATMPVSLATAPSTPVTNVGTFAVQAAQSGGWLMKLADSSGTFLATLPVSLASAPTTAVTQAASSITGSNPCSNPTGTILGINGVTTSTNATQIIALSGSTKIYICSLTVFGVSGTNPTFSLVQGTGSNCANSQTTIVGPWTTAANTPYAFAGPTVAVGVAGQELCYKDGGTSPVQNYNITYVQQ